MMWKSVELYTVISTLLRYSKELAMFQRKRHFHSFFIRLANQVNDKTSTSNVNVSFVKMPQLNNKSVNLICPHNLLVLNKKECCFATNYSQLQHKGIMVSNA